MTGANDMSDDADPLCLKCGHPTSYHLKVYGCVCRCSVPVGPTKEGKQ